MLELPRILVENQSGLDALCRDFGVEKLYAFGSVLTERFEEGVSDLDFVVVIEDVEPIMRGKNLIGLWEGLEELFSCKVDLISDLSVKNPFLASSIQRTKRLVYEAQCEKVLV